MLILNWKHLLNYITVKNSNDYIKSITYKIIKLQTNCNNNKSKSNC